MSDFNPRKKWRDAPAVFSLVETRDRYLRLLFLMALDCEKPEAGRHFWHPKANPKRWADRWLPRVPWRHDVAHDLFNGALRRQQLVSGGRRPRTLPIDWGGDAVWGEPAEPQHRAGESGASFSTRWRRWEATERRRLQDEPGMVEAKLIDFKHLRWLALKMHGATFDAIARSSAPDLRTAKRLDSRIRVVKRAIANANRRLQVTKT